MPEPLRDSTGDAAAETRALGLRLRIWTGCVGGALTVSAGLWWIAGTRVGPGDAADPARLVLSLLAVSGAGLAAGVLLALWLDHHIVGQLRGLSRAFASGAVEKLRDLPATSGWGELSALTHSAHQLLSRDRGLAEVASEQERFRRDLDRLRAAVERWLEDERWEAPSGVEGEAAALTALLDRGLSREREIGEQNREAVRLVRAELLATQGDARESVEQAERGFVEATALLTTVRELQRLGAELHPVLAAGDEPASAAVPDRANAFGDAAAAAIEELVTASVESVEHLAGGLTRVQDIVTQVQVIGNRATLIALNATLRSAEGAGAPGELGEELRTLARDVRVATERTDDLSRALEREVRAASARMAGVRASVAGRLNSVSETLAAPAVPPSGAAVRALEDARRLMERVREMIQDAMRKGERLSAAGERSSSAAQRLARRLDEQVREFEGLAVRLGASSGDEAGRSEPAATLRLIPSQPPGDDDATEHDVEGRP